MRFSLLLPALLGLTTMAFAQEGDDAKDTAWGRSVATEIAGDPVGAEAILVEAWGEDGGNYFVRLRRAYLALRQGRFQEAQARYAALQASDEGASDPDVAAGLRAAQARTLPAEMAVIQAQAWATPEVWGAMVGQTLGNSRYLGGAVFAHVPARVTSKLTLHVAGRYVDYRRQGSGSVWAFGPGGTRQYSLGDAFVAADYQHPWWGVDGLAVYEKISNTSPMTGGNLRGRVGQRYGLLMDGTLLVSAGSPDHWQAVPRIFLWPLPNVGLRAGTRLTFDGRQSTSAMAGASVFMGGHALHLDGHLGNERAALQPASFSLLNLPGDATVGGTVTLVLHLTSTFRLLAQAQGERLKSDGADGSYFSAGLGIDVALGKP